MALPPEDQKSYLLRDLMRMRDTRVMPQNARVTDNDALLFGDGNLSIKNRHKATTLFQELMTLRDKGDE